MPFSPKIIAVAASAAVLVASGATAAVLGSQPAAEQTAVPAAAFETPASVEVLVWVDGVAKRVSSAEGTVAASLSAAEIALGEHDRVSPALGSQLAVGDSVTVTRVAVSEETTKVALDFATTQVNDPTLEKGKTSIKTKGVPGVREDVVRTTTLNGKVDGTEMVSQTVTQEAVNQVILVGTKRAEVSSRSADRPASPKPTAPAAPAPSDPSTAPAASTGGGLDLSRADMWDRIAKCESTNRWNINTGNGYYGGLQFNLQTWRANGGTDFAAYPHQASREQQITVANRLYAKRGLQPWGCRGAA
ncbi:transglycosylase family protein [Propioniciclava flava]